MKSTADSFTRAAATYEQEGRLQKQIALELLEQIPSNANPESILDAGSGTGFLSVLLAAKFPQAQITAADISQGMIDAASQRRSNENIKYICEDFTKLNAEQKFDLIISASALQWCQKPYEAWVKLSAHLKSGAYFLTSFFLDGTWREIKVGAELSGMSDAVMQLPLPEEITGWPSRAALENISIKVQETKLHFADWAAFSRHQKLTGTAKPAHLPKADVPKLRRMLRALAPDKTKGILLTCQWAEMVCRKK